MTTRFDPADPGLKAWDSTIAYRGGDLATYSGAIWRATKDNTNVTPAAGSTWQSILAAPTGQTVGFIGSTTAATPNAAHGVNGTPVTLAPDAGFVGWPHVEELDLIYASVGTETVTAAVTATFDDGTTATGTFTATSTSTHGYDAGAGSSAYDALIKSGHYVTGLSLVVQSSIDASTATVTLKVRANEIR